MKKVIFRPEAEIEILEAQIWYKEQGWDLNLPEQLMLRYPQ